MPAIVRFAQHHGATGYADEAAPVNRVAIERAVLESTTTFHA
ncbi:hypothetical protein [Planotetraspora kaengkrachanensis]|nr:hypothetical protein [Planotetraspora kaengkrachanensis]